MKRTAVLAALLLGTGLSTFLLEGEPDPRAPGAGGPDRGRVAPAASTGAAPRPAAARQTPPAPEPEARPAPPAPGEVEELVALLERLEAGGAPRPGDGARLDDVVARDDLPAPLRAGALRHLVAIRGRGALPGLVELYARPAAAPLRPLVCDACARGAGPDDGPLLERLLIQAEATGEADALLEAALAVAAAARRRPDEAPTDLEPALGERLARALVEVASAAPEGGQRARALEGLGDLGTPSALAFLEGLVRGLGEPPPGAEDRLDAALALAGADPLRGRVALEALEPALDDPLLRERCRRALAR